MRKLRERIFVTPGPKQMAHSPTNQFEATITNKIKFEGVLSSYKLQGFSVAFSESNGKRQVPLFQSTSLLLCKEQLFKCHLCAERKCDETLKMCVKLYIKIVRPLKITVRKHDYRERYWWLSTAPVVNSYRANLHAESPPFSSFFLSHLGHTPLFHISYRLWVGLIFPCDGSSSA